MSKYKYGSTSKLTARLTLDEVSSRNFVKELIRQTTPTPLVPDFQTLRDAIEELKELSQSLESLAVNVHCQISEIEDIIEQLEVQE